ncbi:MAG: gliding motility-associated C-terminal domain-containing protein [Flavobacteriales bacterium]|nr:gliding motility-associated C-terminal domain-containing protein [Flavobacteriales bacterium]
MAVSALMVFGLFTAKAQVCIAGDGVTYETCSGTFYDSGGSTGNYANNENITVTICPAGGAGSGPFTSVRFTQWNVAGGPGDRLRIYNGTAAVGPHLAEGTSINSLNGQTFTSTDPSGCLTFRWESDGSGTAAGWAALILTGPDAGQNATTTVCSSAAPFNMRALLGGTPDAGGTWTGPGGQSHSETFDPATDVSGAYTYTVSGPSPCPDSSAVLTVTLVQAPNAGTNGTLTVCSNSPSVQLFNSLGGAPQVGGSWTRPGGAAHSGTFDPSVDPAGVYTYTVSGTPPCTNATATVTVSITAAPNAGTNGTLTICSDGPATSLFTRLGGTPQAGGTWTAPGGGAHSGTLDPSEGPAGIYTYTVQGTSPCAPASATVTVTINQRPNAGTNGATTVCSNAPAFSLFALLGGSPQPGGTWSGPGGGSVNATYTPGVSIPGTYTYTLTGTAPCLASTSSVSVTQVTAPNAGIDRSIVVCSNDASFSMRSQLNGTPAAGGTWVGPGGAHGDQFNPAVDPPGNYTYTVVGTAPCANATAVLSITVRTAPRAGTSASVTVCSTDASFALFSVLGGTPDNGGTWTAPGGAVHPGTFIPGTSAPGIYTYTVTGQSPCVPATATVTVSVNTAPNAGTNANVVRCSNDAAFSLFSQLGGTPNAGGTWTGPSGPHGSTFTPGVDTPGAYTYTVVGLSPCTNATAVVNVSVVTAPNAGSDGTITVCSNNAPFALIGVLGGTPDATGTWTGPSGASSGTFTPGTSAAGVYTYTVAGNAPCANATATVTVTVVQAPVAGTNGSLTICSDQSSVALFSFLGGSPQNGGTWTRPNGQPHSGTYFPGSEVGGVYTYTVAGTTPCANASATVQVNRVIAPNAGVNGTITVCSTNAPFALISVLGGSPSGSGSWLAPGNVPVSGTFTPGTSVPGLYTYVVPGTAPCVNDSAFVTVFVNQAPQAGQNASLLVCSSDSPFQLFGLLGGTPDQGGSWTRPNGTSHSGTFTPGLSIPGGYTYTVPGVTPCLAASAVVTVSVNIQPVAGTSSSFQRCSTDGPVDLFSQLGGSPNGGGVWTGPSGPSSGVFIPGTSTPGAYIYTVTGTAPCSNATATVTATVNQAPNAGTGSTITVCQGTSSLDLFTGLTDNPDLTGTWNDDDLTGQLSGNMFSPLGLPPGNYDFTYTVPGIGQCGADQASVRVTIVPLLDAGSNGTLPVCGSNSQVNLFNGLGGTPQQGGQWIDLSATGALSGQFFNASLVVPGSYVFRYRLIGIVGCDSDSAQVTVNVQQAPNAGTNGSAVTCSNSPSFPLFQFLGGSPTLGGQWRRNSPSGPPYSGTYDPNLDNSGSFYYVVNGAPPCTSVNSFVTVTEVPEPNAGQSASTVVCSNGQPFNMTALLGGNPDPGGTWSLGGQNHSATFVPGLDVQGIYEYRVTGQPPCNDKISTLTITVVPAANAGCNSSVTTCTGALPFLLVNALGCSPQTGGTWTGPGGASTGTFSPGTSQPGEYFYVVQGTAPCVNDTSSVIVFVDPSPNAGTPGPLSLCSGGPTVNLLSALGGTPDPSGIWTGPLPSTAVFSGLFQPGISTAGTYIYTVTNSCGTATSSVVVSVTTQANAGCSNAIVRCSTAAPFAMVDQLGCSPALNGAWVGPLPATTVMNGIFTPGVTAPGTYRYTVQGVGACPAVSSTLTVTVNPAPNAGNDANITLCNTGGAVNLFPLLGPNAQPGGTWRRQSDNAIHSGTILPSVDQTDIYIYSVPGLAPCVADEALVDVVINASPSAGFNGLLTVCSNALPVVLFSQLGGTPQSNGFWLNPTLTLHSGVYLPGQDQPGVYAYVVAGLSPCTADTARVTVIQNTATNAGTNGTALICSDQPPFQLSAYLGGTPQNGGTWTGPGGNTVSGQYTPGVSQPGVYRYRVTGIAPCVSDSATVTVVQNQAPKAGTSTAVQICSSQGVVELITLLGGNPDAGGVWTLNGDPHGPNYDPATEGSGTFIYTVAGAPPCGNATAQVSITLVLATSAGTNGAIAACIDDQAISLFPGLGGSPSLGGVWTNNSGQGVLSDGIWDATGVPPGSYTFTYSVVGSAPCPGGSSFVTVNLSPALNAGDDVVLDACQGQLVDLFASLTGSPQAGGAWVDVNNSGGLIGAVFNTVGIAPGSTWHFDYVLSASSQCEPDTGRVTVTVLDGPYAGCDGSLNVCSTSPPIALATGLGCGPDGGGFWLTPSLTPHSGTFLPATNAPGAYRYVVPGVGSCPADTAVVNVQVVPAANAGADANLNLCSTDGPVDMFLLLGASAQPGGTWVYVTGGNVPHTNIYNPAIHSPGIYRYRVTGQLPCPNDDAFVNVTEPQAPNAGCDNTLTICSSQSPVNMFSALACNPQPGGSWTFVTGGGTSHGQFFDPASDLSGVYRYTVSGAAPCQAAFAELTVVLITAGNAGQDATVQACVTQAAFDLFSQLGGAPQAGGVWTDVNGSGALSGSTFDPALAGTGTWPFRYTIAANGPCAEQSSVVTVIVGNGISAGGDSSVTVCGSITDYSLFEALAGSPTTGGTWVDQLGTGALLPGGVLNATLLSAGTVAGYTYTVTDPGCGSLSATVVVTISEYPDAGIGGAFPVCITSAPVPLFGQLTGSPQPGGTWNGPDGLPHGNTFDPAVDDPGNYTYTVLGNAACPNATAVLAISLAQPANAGLNGEIQACDTVTSLELFNGLNGTPQSGGTWQDLSGSGALDNGTVNTTLLVPGEYLYRYTVTVAGCGSATALVKVLVLTTPRVVDLLLTCIERDRTYVISFSISEGDTATYVVSGVPGTIVPGEPYTFISDPIPTSQPFDVGLSDGYACGTSIINGTSPCTFNDDVFVPQSFSPNGDGVNERLLIPGIEGFPGNSIVVFNRWGGTVYEANGYDNVNTVWDGTSPKAVPAGNAPAGTYYYVLDLGNGKEALTGYIYLNR